MARSLGFGSDASNFHPKMVGRPVQTRFRCAYAYRLKLARHTNSLAHYTKGTPSPHEEAPTACRHPVSGLFHSPRRSEEHTSELQSLMRISYAVFCLKKKNKKSTKLTSNLHTEQH